MSNPSAPIQAIPFEARLPCPICLGSKMEKVVLTAPHGVLVLDHCSRCGGVWFEKGEPQRLATHEESAFSRHIPVRTHVIRPPCHGCGAPLARQDAACGVCSRENDLRCPSCDTKMPRVAHAGLTFDVCNQCKGVWFDHEELRAVWTLKFSDLTHRNRSASSVAGDSVLFEALLWSPDLIFYGTYAAMSGIGETVTAVGSIGPEAAPGVVDAIGEGATDVFDAITSIIAGLFD